MDDSEQLTPRASVPAWHYLLVSGVAAICVFWCLGDSTLDEHECKLAVTARSMIDPHRPVWMYDGDKKYTVPPETAFNRSMVPVENGQPRLVKTPLPYWTAALAGMGYKALGGEGEAINGWTARFASAIATILLGCVTLSLGRRLLPPRSALLGAVMLVTCIGVLKWGRNGRPEMLLCLMMCVAMLCFFRGVESPTRRGHILWMLAFWLAMGLGNLAKEFVPLLLAWPLLGYVCWREAPEATLAESPARTLRWFLLASLAGLSAFLAVTMLGNISSEKTVYAVMAVAFGLPMLWLVVRTKAWRSIASLLPTAIPGAILMAVMFVPWMLYMSHLFPGLADETFAEQTAERAAGGKFQMNAPFFYVVPVLQYTLPWVAMLPGAILAAFLKPYAKHRRGLAFLLLWVVGIVFLFTAAGGKRTHYILPMMPALCLLCGYVADDVFFRHEFWKPWTGKAIAWGYAILGILAPAVTGVLWAVASRIMPPGSEPVEAPSKLSFSFASAKAVIIESSGAWPTMTMVLGGAAVLAVVMALLAWRGRLRAVPAAIAAALVVISIGIAHFEERWDTIRCVADFARQVRSTVPADQNVYHWSSPSTTIVYYFGQHLPWVQMPYEMAHPEFTPQQIDELPEFRADIKRRDPDMAPWIITYLDQYKSGQATKTNARLEMLGYQVVFARKLQTERGLTIGLFHREPKRVKVPASVPATASMSATASR